VIDEDAEDARLIAVHRRRAELGWTWYDPPAEPEEITTTMYAGADRAASAARKARWRARAKAGLT
jgi:hypothetical protein